MLPAKLQSRKKEIPASELVIKAIEFITLLREVLALGPEEGYRNCEETNGDNEEEYDSSQHHENSHNQSNQSDGFSPKASRKEVNQNADSPSPQHLHTSHEMSNSESYDEYNTSTEQNVCIEINPSDILPPPDDSSVSQASDIRFSKPLDCAQVKSTISLPRNLRITPVGKLNQSVPSRVGAQSPNLIRHQILSSNCQNSSSQARKSDEHLPPPTLIRKEGSQKTPTSILGHKVIKIPPANGEKGLPTVIEFPKGSPFLTKLDTKIGEDECDQNDFYNRAYSPSTPGQSLLRRHLQEPAKGIQDSTDKQKIRIRKDLVASPEANKYNISGNTDVSSFLTVTSSSSSGNFAKIPFSQTGDFLEHEEESVPQICISSVESLKNKENPFTETLRRDSIERRRGRPVVPKKSSKFNSSRQSQQFNGDLKVFKDFDKYDFFNYLSTRCLRINDKDAETILTYNWVHDLLFEKIFSLCSELQFARFCQVASIASDIFNPISPHSSRSSLGYKEGRRHCVLLENPGWMADTIKGTVNLSGRNYCLPLVLLKLFRPSFEQVLLSKIVLYSKKQCDISNPNVNVGRDSTICINPWHYERCDEEKFLSKSVGHECQVRLFADAENGTRTLCFLCKSPGVIEKMVPSIPTLPLTPPTPPPSSLELTPINVTNNVIPDQEQELKIYVERPKYIIGSKHKIVTIRKRKPLSADVKGKSANNEEGESDKKRPTVRRPQIKYDGSVCINCSTTKTTLWRRTAEAQLICNACGCYLKLHGRHRPIKYKSDAIRTRSRRRNATKKKLKPDKVVIDTPARDDTPKSKLGKIAEELEQKSLKEEEQSTKALNILFQSAKIKETPRIDEKTVEEMEEDFEGMIKEFEDEINKEGHDTKENPEIHEEQVTKEVFNQIKDVIIKETGKNIIIIEEEGKSKELPTEVCDIIYASSASLDRDTATPKDDDPDEILLIIDETREIDSEDNTEDVEMNDLSIPPDPNKSNANGVDVNGSIEDTIGLEAALEDTISVNAVEDTISVSSGTTDSGTENRKKRFINVIDGNTNGIDITDLKREVVDVDSDTTTHSEKSDKIRPSKRSSIVRPSTINTLKEKCKSSMSAKSSKLPGHYGYQCRRCFDWFDTKSALNNHNCTKRYLMSENGNISIYVCKFCGCFEHNKDEIQPHVERCKTFGFTNLYHSEGFLDQQQNCSSGDDNIATRKGRKRPNRQTLSSKEESTCSQCNYVSQKINN
jgi:hypothetical protein